MRDISRRIHKPKTIPEYWPVMTFYERFEHIVVIIVSLIISLVIVSALLQLIAEIYHSIVLGVFDPHNHEAFQAIFGMIMTLLIAMEFKHSILKVLERQSHIIQAKTILLIALLALARKFIVINLETTEPLKLIGLGFSVLVLSGAYWILNQYRD